MLPKVSIASEPSYGTSRIPYTTDMRENKRVEVNQSERPYKYYYEDWIRTFSSPLLSAAVTGTDSFDSSPLSCRCPPPGGHVPPDQYTGSRR